jgi:hypothetical protein
VMAGGDRDEPYAGRTTKRLTSGARSGLACARRQAGDGPREEDECGRAGRRGRGFGPGIGPVGGGLFSFSFYFLIPISLFASFSFEQIILWIF